MDSGFIIGFEAKFYQNSSPASLYAGPLFAVYWFNTGFRSLIGLTTGFDRYERLIIFRNRMALRLGIELQGGVGTEGDRFIGLGLNIEIGYLNTGKVRPDY